MVLISDSKHYKEVINEKEIYKEIIDELYDAVYIIGKEDGLIKYANKGAEKLFGYTIEELKGKNIYELYDAGEKSSREYADDILSSIDRTGKWEQDAQGIRKDGEKFWDHVKVFAFNHIRMGEIIISTHQNITKQRKAEDQIDYQLKLIDQVDSAIVTYDLDNKISSWNKYAEVLYQWKKEEVIGKDAIDIFVPDHLRNQYYSGLKILESSGKFEMDGELVRKDGTSIPGHIFTNYLRNKNAKIVGYIRVSYDLTIRQKALDALKASEKKFRNLTNLLPQVVFEIDPDGNIQYINKQANRVLGYSVREFRQGINVMDILHPLELDRAKNNIENALLGLDIGDPEYTIRKSDGSYIPILIYVGRIVENKQPVGLRGIMVDISDIKNFQETLKVYGRIFNETLNEICVFDTETYKIHLVNRSAQENLGYTYEELTDLTLLDLIPRLDLDRFSNKIAPLKTGQRSKIFLETKLLRKNQTEYPAELYLQLLERQEGNQFAAIIIDISERRANEEELKKHRENLEELVKERTLELEAKKKELENMLRTFVGRELKIRDLQDEIQSLKANME